MLCWPFRDSPPPSFAISDHAPRVATRIFSTDMTTDSDLQCYSGNKRYAGKRCLSKYDPLYLCGSDLVGSRAAMLSILATAFALCLCLSASGASVAVPTVTTNRLINVQVVPPADAVYVKLSQDPT